MLPRVLEIQRRIKSIKYAKAFKKHKSLYQLSCVLEPCAVNEISSQDKRKQANPGKRKRSRSTLGLDFEFFLTVLAYAWKYNLERDFVIELAK